MRSTASSCPTMTEPILLDTNAAIWWTADSLGQEALENLTRARIDQGILVSPVTAWEVGQIFQHPARADVVGLIHGPVVWYKRLLSLSQVRECALDGSIALASTMLPGEFHRDPADRFLVATARALNCTLMTRDRKILAYAEQGHVKAVPC